MAGSGAPQVFIQKAKTVCTATTMHVNHDGRPVSGGNGSSHSEREDVLTTDSSLGEFQAAAENPSPDLPLPTQAEVYQPQMSDDYIDSGRGQSSLMADAPDREDNEPAAMHSLKLPANRLPDDRSIQHQQEDNAETRRKMLGDGNRSTQNQSGGAQGSESFSGCGEYGPAESDLRGRSVDGEGLGSTAAPWMGSSLTMDEGGSSLTGNSIVESSHTCDGTQSIYAFNHKGVVLSESDHEVYIISIKQSDVLKSASVSDCFEDGASPLLQIEWIGQLTFYLTKWKLTLQAGTCGTSQLKDLKKELYKTLTAWDIQSVRKTAEQLHRDHSAFLHSFSWDGGPVIFLEHTDENKRPEFCRSPLKDQVQRILLQLLPSWGQDLLTWEEPVVYYEEQKEDGGQSPSLEAKSAAYLDTSGDSNPCSKTLSEQRPKLQRVPADESLLEKAVCDKEEKEDGGQSLGLGAKSATYTATSGGSDPFSKTFSEPLSKVQHVPSDKSFLDRTSSHESSSSSRALSQALEQVIEDKVLSCQALKQEPQKHAQELRKQFEKLAAQVEPYKEQIETLEKKLACQTKMTENLQKQVEEFRRNQTAEMAEKDKIWCKKLEDMERNFESRMAEMSKTLELNKEELKKEVMHSMLHMAAGPSQKEEAVNVSDEVTKRCEEFKKAFQEEVVQGLQKRSADLQAQLEEVQKKYQEEETKFQSAQEGLKVWCTKFEQKGQRILEGSLQQLRETDLQRRELHAQKDKQLASALEKFMTKVSTGLSEQQQQIEERLKAFHAHVLQESVLKQGDQQASLIEVHKLRKEMYDCLKNLQNGSSSGVPDYTAGACFIQEPEGAVGGNPNMFAQALTKSEESMLKVKTKDEVLASNQLQEKLHLPLISESASRHFDTVGAVQNGSRSKAIPSGKQRAETNKGKGHESPPTERKRGSGNTSESIPLTTGSCSKAVPSDKQRAETSKGKGQESPPTERKQGSGNISDGSESPSSAAEASAGANEDDDFTMAEEFLDWINIRGNLTGSKDMERTITKHVKAALKKEEKPASRAKSLDTILCLDVSGSIVEAGHLDTVKKTALDFVDGIENLMVEMDLEENIAVVALGGHARVLQHLTNDLTLVREAIDSLDERGGRSPFMQALLVCMAANKGRGGIVSISGVYRVRPRIIFITDGYLTDESQDTGPDRPSNQSQCNYCLVQLLSQLASKKHRSTPQPIDWVPVGNADKEFMNNMAKLSGGQLVLPEDIRSLCRYYKVQQTIGRLLKMMKKDSSIMLEDKIRELLVALTADTMSAEEKDFITKEVMRLQKAPVEEEELEADDFDNVVFEDEEKVKNGELLCLGARVKRGPDWKWKNQDTEGFGTVVQHSKDNNWIHVKWDNGTCNAYRYNEQNMVDVQEVQHNPRQIPADSTSLDFGVRVVKGPDWKWDNQDGKGQGTVIRVHDSEGKVKVRWDMTRKVYKYKYGAEVKEVEIIIPEFPRKSAEPQIPGKEKYDADKTIAMWQWRDEQRQWRLYEEHINVKLEAEYQKRPTGSCVIGRAGQSRRVSFKFMQDKAVDNGSTTEVKREMVDEERKNDLLAIELSLQYS